MGPRDEEPKAPGSAGRSRETAGGGRWAQSSEVPRPGVAPAAGGGREGAPAGVWEGKLDRLGVARGDGARRGEGARRCSGSKRGGMNRAAAGRPRLGFSAKRLVDIATGRKRRQGEKEEDARLSPDTENVSGLWTDRISSQRESSCLRRAWKSDLVPDSQSGAGECCRGLRFISARGQTPGTCVCLVELNKEPGHARRQGQASWTIVSEEVSSALGTETSFLTHCCPPGPLAVA